MRRIALTIHLTPNMRDALYDACGNSDSLSGYIRKVLAAHIDYDLTQACEEDWRGRPRKYANDAERKAAEAAQRRERRAENKRMIEAYTRTQKLAALNVIREAMGEG
jgi:hypothetical protein